MIMNDYYSTGRETQTWLDFSLACKYINESQHKELHDEYEHILAMMLSMIKNVDKWTIK